MSKVNLCFDDQCKRRFLFLWNFLKKIENMFSIKFLSSYRRKFGRTGKKLWTHSPIGSCFLSISRSPKLPLMLLELNSNTVLAFNFIIVAIHAHMYSVPEILECQSPCACPDPMITSPRVKDRPDHLKL